MKLFWTFNIQIKLNDSRASDLNLQTSFSITRTFFFLIASRQKFFWNKMCCKYMQMYTIYMSQQIKSPGYFTIFFNLWKYVRLENYIRISHRKCLESISHCQFSGFSFILFLVSFLVKNCAIQFFLWNRNIHF